MRVWPIVLDSRPPYLRGRGRSTSLLLAPLGTGTVIEHIVSAFQPITGNAPLIVAPDEAHERYADWVSGVCPRARVVKSADEFSDALATHELSDALLLVDPCCIPIRGFQFSELVHQYTAESRVSHHLVAFEKANAGTRERVAFDASGQVRGIQRFYEKATWPFIAGISATLVPIACGVLSDGIIPRSLVELRHLLMSHGVPSRDVPIEGGTVDLSDERGMLAANEQFLVRSTRGGDRDGAAPTVYVGNGHTVHPTARLIGPVVVHAGAWIGENATVLGPAVIGAGARVETGAVVAHATIGPDCVVPEGRVVRDRAWFEIEPGIDPRDPRDPSAMDQPHVAYGERLARLSMDIDEEAQTPQAQDVGRRWSLMLKRAMDVAVAGLSLAILSPLLAVIAALIRLESRGPIFYGDRREGRHGRVFGCWKFRTMYTGAHLAQRDLLALDQTDGPHFKVERDPRVTRVGRILRTVNLDEIPQLVNVLLGEMSLVGPRPSPFRENQVCVPWREARLSVRPGITGFWQVCRHNRAAGDFHQWIEYDLLYVQHLSLWLDLKILGATLLTLGGKATHIQASWLVGSRVSGRVPATPGLAKTTPQAAAQRRDAEQPVTT
jgi:lipopolysaccharide/colanic/teichoic acid biosynthesis glycosyltransferase